MAWGKPFTDVEVTYVRAHYPKMGCSAIAAKLGRSTRGVENVVKRLGLREPRADARAVEDARTPAREAAASDGAPQDELAELREMKRILKRTMRDEIDPRTMPKISEELRAVIRRISELEGGGDDGTGGAMAGGSGSIVVSVPLRPA